MELAGTSLFCWCFKLEHDSSLRFQIQCRVLDGYTDGPQFEKCSLAALIMLGKSSEGSGRSQRSPKRFSLPLGEDGRKLVKHEFHYLALEHHVDRHIG